MTIEYDTLKDWEKYLINQIVICNHARALILEDYCRELQRKCPDKKDIIRIETKKIADAMHEDFKKLRRQFGGMTRLGQFSSFDERKEALQQEIQALFEEKKKMLLNNLGMNETTNKVEVKQDE